LGLDTALKIEAAIALADLPPGAVIGTCQELSQRYDVGRRAIREAVRIVELRGLGRMRPGPGGGLIVASPVLEVVASTAGRHLMLSGALTSEDVRDARAVLAATAAELAAAAPASSIAQLGAWIDAHPLSRERYGKQECHSMSFPCALAAASGNLAAILFSKIAAPAVANMAGPDNPWIVTRDLAIWSRDTELQILHAIRCGDAQTAIRSASDYVRRLDAAGSPKYGPRPLQENDSVIARTRAGQVARSIIFSLAAQREKGETPYGVLGTIDALCAREGVCRSTAVQALRMLEISGVITVKVGRNQGYFLKPITPQNIADQMLAYLRSRPGSDKAIQRFGVSYRENRASIDLTGRGPNTLLLLIEHVLNAFNQS
jgi:DNA-binding FadR family transcriptional regulator